MQPEYDFLISIERVKKALQRSTHLSDSQLWMKYPEFMTIWNNAVLAEYIEQMQSSTKKRAKVILKKTSDKSMDFTYLLDIIRDLKGQRPNTRFLRMIQEALAINGMSSSLPEIDDDVLAEYLSNLYDTIYEDTKDSITRHRNSSGD